MTPTNEAPHLLDILKDILEAGWRRRYVICIPIVLMIPFGLLAARMAPKSYEARTILLLQEPSLSNPFLGDFAIGLNLKERTGALRSLLRSEHILLGVLRDMGRIDSKANPADVALEVRKLANSVSVEFAGGNLIELRLTGQEPRGMGAMLKAIADRFLDQLLSPEKSLLESTRAFLKQQMEAQQADLRALEEQLAALRRENEEKLAEPFEVRVRQLVMLEDQLRQAREQEAAARIEIENARAQIIRDNPGIRELDRRIADTRAELALLSARYEPEHSQIAALQQRLAQLQGERQRMTEQIAALQAHIGHGDITASLEAAGAGVDSLLTEVRRAAARAAAKAREVATIELKIAEMRELLSEIEPIRAREQALKSDVEQARSRYNTLRERYNNASISYALGQFQAPERVKVIDAPSDPKAPITPPGIIYLVASVFGGISLGVGLGIVLELLDQRLRAARDFRKLAGVDVVARLPKMDMA